jgi:mannose-6-phosphate isomerase-like protein (cupin superfamily)
MTDEHSSPTGATVFRFEAQELRHDRAVKVLCHSDLMLGAAQTIRAGGENNLHAHEYLDGVWFVLSGRARFYTTDDELVADLGPREGVLIPRLFPYWFESSGDEALEILQIEASVKPVDSLRGFGEGRINYTPLTDEMLTVMSETTQH